MAHKPVSILRHSLLLIAALVAVASLTGSPVRAQPGSGKGILTLFEPVRGELRAGHPSDDWVLEGRAGQPVALLVTSTGGLDPTLEGLAPDGTSVAANDDLDSLVRDAGVEALILPADGTYTVRVARYEGENGATEGPYELLALPGYADLVRREDFSGNETTWIAADSGSASLAQGRLRLRAPEGGGLAMASPSDAIPLRDFYFQVDARVFGTPAYAEFGLVVRIPTAPGASNQGYTFKVNTAGQWSVLVTDPSGQYVLQGWTADPALEAGEWTIGVLARDTTLSFYGNGALLGSVTDGRLTEAGRFGVIAATDAAQDAEAVVLFDNAVITRRLGTTYRGMPLALTAWDNPDPSRVVAELANTGLVTPRPVHDLYIPARALDATTQRSLFELVGSEQALYDDFIMGASVVIGTDEGASPGCGVVFRYQDERNLGLAYVDVAEGFGLVQAQDGELTTNIYDRVRLNQTTPDALGQRRPDRLLVIAQGEQVSVYVNGALVAQETLVAEPGRAGIALLNYENAVTHCVIGDLWVWPLMSEGGDE